MQGSLPPNVSGKEEGNGKGIADRMERAVSADYTCTPWWMF
jgi:hypothetical protein